MNTPIQIRQAFKNVCGMSGGRTNEEARIHFDAWTAILENNPKEVVSAVTASVRNADNRLREFKASAYFINKIRPYVAKMGYTDIYPFEVVRVVSATCVEIRAMKCELVEKPVCLGVGGFAANFDNNSQRWDCTPDAEAQVIRIRLGKKGWGAGQFRMTDQPIKHYDYNF